MRRRRFLQTGGAGFAASLAGCGALKEEVENKRQHPYAGKTLTVRVDSVSETTHDVEQITREALDYWEANSDDFVGFDIEFEIGGGNPDLIVAYADDPEVCQDLPAYSEQVLGCAPVLRPGNEVQSTQTARVVAADRPRGNILVTTQHELGHVLGLGHTDEPHEIMSNRPEDRIPLYGVRLDIWADLQETQQQVNRALILFNHGVETWNDENYQGATAAFEDAKSEFETAAGMFRDTREKTSQFENGSDIETVELEELRVLLDRLVDRAEQTVSFAGSMGEAASAAESGDADRANTKRAEANEGIQSLSDIDPVQFQEVAMALGLVRGLNRKETLVRVGEETI